MELDELYTLQLKLQEGEKKDSCILQKEEIELQRRATFCDFGFVSQRVEYIVLSGTMPIVTIFLQTRMNAEESQLLAIPTQRAITLLDLTCVLAKLDIQAMESSVQVGTGVVDFCVSICKNV